MPMLSAKKATKLLLPLWTLYGPLSNRSDELLSIWVGPSQERANPQKVKHMKQLSRENFNLEIVISVAKCGSLSQPNEPLFWLQGVFHVEAKYTSRGPRLIEVNCRMGGGPVRTMNQLVWGVDLVEEHLLTAAGIPSRPPIHPRPQRPIAEFSVNAKKTGTLQHADFCEVRELPFPLNNPHPPGGPLILLPPCPVSWTHSACSQPCPQRPIPKCSVNAKKTGTLQHAGFCETPSCVTLLPPICCPPLSCTHAPIPTAHPPPPPAPYR